MIWNEVYHFLMVKAVRETFRRPRSWWVDRFFSSLCTNAEGFKRGLWPFLISKRRVKKKFHRIEISLLNRWWLSRYRTHEPFCSLHAPCHMTRVTWITLLTNEQKVTDFLAHVQSTIKMNFFIKKLGFSLIY